MNDQTTESVPSGHEKSLTRPRSVMIASLLLSAGLFWFSTSNVEFHRTPTLTGFHTGGWFLLGFPIILGLSLLLALACTAIARRTDARLALVVVVVIYGGLTALTISGKLPSSRLPHILGPVDLQRIEIRSFRTRDSFNDGDFVSGILVLPRDMFLKIVAQQDLRPAPDQSLDKFRVAALPERGTLWTNRTLAVFYDEGLEQLYFSAAR